MSKDVDVPSHPLEDLVLQWAGNDEWLLIDIEYEQGWCALPQLALQQIASFCNSTTIQLARLVCSSWRSGFSLGVNHLPLHLIARPRDSELLLQQFPQAQSFTLYWRRGADSHTTTAQLSEYLQVLSGLERPLHIEIREWTGPLKWLPPSQLQLDLSGLPSLSQWLTSLSLRRTCGLQLSTLQALSMLTSLQLSAGCTSSSHAAAQAQQAQAALFEAAAQLPHMQNLTIDEVPTSREAPALHRVLSGLQARPMLGVAFKASLPVYESSSSQVEELVSRPKLLPDEWRAPSRLVSLRSPCSSTEGGRSSSGDSAFGTSSITTTCSIVSSSAGTSSSGYSSSSEGGGSERTSLSYYSTASINTSGSSVGSSMAASSSLSSCRANGIGHSIYGHSTNTRMFGNKESKLSLRIPMGLRHADYDHKTELLYRCLGQVQQVLGSTNIGLVAGLFVKVEMEMATGLETLVLDLSPLKGLERLHLWAWRPSSPAPELVLRLRGMPYLKHLRISYREGLLVVDQELMELLAFEARQLRKLDITGAVAGSSLKALSRLTMLTSLELWNRAGQRSTDKSKPGKSLSSPMRAVLSPHWLPGSLVELHLSDVVFLRPSSSMCGPVRPMTSSAGGSSSSSPGGKTFQQQAQLWCSPLGAAFQNLSSLSLHRCSIHDIPHVFSSAQFLQSLHLNDVATSTRVSQLAAAFPFLTSLRLLLLPDDWLTKAENTTAFAQLQLLRSLHLGFGLCSTVSGLQDDHHYDRYLLPAPHQQQHQQHQQQHQQSSQQLAQALQHQHQQAAASMQQPRRSGVFNFSIPAVGGTSCGSIDAGLLQLVMALSPALRALNIEGLKCSSQGAMHLCLLRSTDLMYLRVVAERSLGSSTVLELQRRLPLAHVVLTCDPHVWW